MRYRVKDYRVEVSENIVWLYFQAPDEVILTSKSDNEIEDYILQAIRLVVDESAGIVFCSSMQKHKYIQHAKANVDTREVKIAFDIPSGKIIGNDLFTIEMDWGDTINDNIPTDYAKETTAQQAASDAAEAKVASQALSPIAQAAEAYNTGKVQLAKNITTKGVQASATETLPELAEKVSAIAQESYTIDGGEMYAKQLFGSLETPNYWNLYDVLEQLLSDGRLVSYGGILLAEYYRDYDSINLSGAGSGGAYVVSDIENGQFKMYTEDTRHTWETEFDGKGNRWVAYCFANEYHDFEITDTNTSPRSIFIGRKVGTIKNLVNGLISQIVVLDNSELNGITGEFTNSWNSRITIRNINNFTGLYRIGDKVQSMFVSAKTITGDTFRGFQGDENNTGILTSIVLIAERIAGNFGSGIFRGRSEFLNTIIMQANTIDYSLKAGRYSIYFNSLKDVFICADTCYFNAIVDVGTYNLHLFYMNKRGGVFNIYNGSKVKDVLLQDEWCKPLDVSSVSNLTEANMYAHILQRLKQDEPDCGDGVTITLGSTNLAKLTSAESVQLLDDLTNIYGYTFA